MNMKQKYLLIGIIVICVIIGGIFLFKGISQKGGAIPFAGWLFKVDSFEGEKLFLVTTEPTCKENRVLTENQVKKITRLENIYPNKKPNISPQEAQQIMDENIKKYTNLEFDMFLCLKDCEDWNKRIERGWCEGVENCIIPPGGIPNEARNCDNYCANEKKEWQQKWEEKEKSYLNISIGYPLVLVFINLEPQTYVIPIHKNREIICTESIDANSGKWTGGCGGNYLSGFFSISSLEAYNETKYKKILDSYLKQNKIDGTIQESFYVWYSVKDIEAMHSILGIKK